jgi:hypothetical protein
MYMLSRFRSANRLLPHDSPIFPTINIKYATQGGSFISSLVTILRKQTTTLANSITSFAQSGVGHQKWPARLGSWASKDLALTTAQWRCVESIAKKIGWRPKG